MNTVEEFDVYFDQLGLRYFSPSELRFMGASNASGKAKGKNTLPPEAQWAHLASVALAADEIREQFGHPLRVLSAYRSPAYNKAIGGASQSYHMHAMALDLQPLNGDVQGLYDSAVQLRGLGVFQGGIGKYSSFVHIDVRGHKADW